MKDIYKNSLNEIIKKGDTVFYYKINNLEEFSLLSMNVNFPHDHIKVTLGITSSFSESSLTKEGAFILLMEYINRIKNKK